MLLYIVVISYLTLVHEWSKLDFADFLMILEVSDEVFYHIFKELNKWLLNVCEKIVSSRP